MLYTEIERYIERIHPGHVMKDWPDELIEYVADTGDVNELENFITCEACGATNITTDADHNEGCPLAMYDEPAYVAFLEQEAARGELAGAPNTLTCYDCSREVKVVALGPVIDKVDPTRSYKLACGHVTI